jgi:hypothetical protein
MLFFGIAAIAIGIIIDGETVSLILTFFGVFLLVVRITTEKEKKRHTQAHIRKPQNNDVYKDTGESRESDSLSLNTAQTPIPDSERSPSQNNLKTNKKTGFELTPPPKADFLQSAITLSMDVKFRYTKKDGEVSHRNVMPKRLFLGDYGIQYLRAYDYTRKAERTFRISRIDELE